MAGNPDTKHPLYLDREEEWRLMRDSARGETAIKAAGEEYLPVPSGFNLSPQKTKLYEAYQARAQFPEIVAPTIQEMVGIIHSREIRIDLPDAMVDLWEAATPDGLPLEAFHRRITGEILETGRYGVLVGAASTGSELPYLVGYGAEAIINWSDEKDFYVLDESGYVRDGFEWREENSYRELALVNGKYKVTQYTGDNLAAGNPVEPTARGAKALDFIPFEIAGPRDLSHAPETPPLIGVARAAKAIYQISADYRWQMFMSGQETFVCINADAPEAVGAGVVVTLKAEKGADGTAPNVDAKYVGPSGVGIAAHKTAIDDEKRNAAAAGARMFNTGQSSSQESGEARRMRFAAETASLTSVAHSSCALLEKSLRNVGRMMGLSDAEIDGIVVYPPKDLMDRRLSPEEVDRVMALVEKGHLSFETAYESLQEGEWASAERTWEEERELMDKEDVDRSGSDAMAAVAPAAEFDPDKYPNMNAVQTALGIRVQI